MGNYCSVRGYLLISLVFDNASRPVAISNMTLDECKRATNRDHGYVIGVIIMLHLYFEKYEFMLSIYGIKSREQVQIQTILSLSQSGGAMDSSPITTQMSYFWKRALKIDITGPSRISPTLVRKYTTLTVHQHFPEIKRSTANLLCHSSRVTESNYALYDNQKKAVNASNMVKDVQRSTLEEGDKTSTEFSEIFIQNVVKNNKVRLDSL